MTADQYFLIVPASGIGSRMNTQVPKQYLKLDNGLSVLDQTLKTLLNIEKITGCVVAINPSDDQFHKSVYAQHPKLLASAIGGKERFHSVISALKALAPFANENDWVLVHDAARPCIQEEDVLKLISKLKDHKYGGLLAIPAVDTIKQAKNNLVDKTLDRSKLWQAQTPQMYRFGVLSKALNNALSNNYNITDEASSVEYLGLESVLIAGKKSNLKITTPEDLILANFYLNYYDN